MHRSYTVDRQTMYQLPKSFWSISAGRPAFMHCSSPSNRCHDDPQPLFCGCVIHGIGMTSIFGR